MNLDMRREHPPRPLATLDSRVNVIIILNYFKSEEI